MRVLHKPINAMGLINSLMVGAALAPALAGALAHPASAQPQPTSLRFVVIPKLSHPWYEAVRGGAQQAATMIEQQSRATAAIDYRAPAKAEVALQEEILQAAIRSRPSGITIDLLDADRLRPLLEQARQQGIAVNVFDAEAPAGLPLTSIGNDFCQQARIASERLVQLLGGQGEVAIMQGVPTAPNHAIRARCHRDVFAKHPGIKVVASPMDHDDIAIAQQEATTTMGRYPQLRGWVVSDAGGGIGVGRAVAALGRTGQVKVVALDDLPDLLQLINSGVVDSTAATKPRSQGYWAVLNLWQQGLGAPPIQRIDTGISVQGAAAK
ncbi:substrate-binding domain-containing protein [Synechococcus sp. BA-132 BA5]|uniref:substrate-binding domain-containing protein n=1 Tax=Synechococcus sp. BA-132 BA5 TaxID=3110252 RepID=UPI002B20D470|nr:substrate-binding domain-containing protein [Synechococcus sp. BA-132 BA5]MEA5416373.1 substrate-binding domain-containing protein [Synechococcus sp. BA-132 BA5]